MHLKEAINSLLYTLLIFSIVNIVILCSAYADPFSVDLFPDNYVKEEQTSPLKPKEITVNTTQTKAVSKKAKEKESKQTTKLKQSQNKHNMLAKSKKNMSFLERMMIRAINEFEVERKRIRDIERERELKASKKDSLTKKIKALGKSHSKKRSSVSNRKIHAPIGKGNKPTSDAIVSLLVAASPQSHYASTIHKLAQLNKVYSIPVGEIYIIQNKPSFRSILSSFTGNQEVAKSLSQLTAAGASIKPMASIPKFMNGNSSPVWLVQHEGKTHVFEGYQNPASFFDAHSNFIAHDFK